MEDFIGTIHSPTIHGCEAKMDCIIFRWMKSDCIWKRVTVMRSMEIRIEYVGVPNSTLKISSSSMKQKFTGEALENLLLLVNENSIDDFMKKTGLKKQWNFFRSNFDLQKVYFRWSPPVDCSRFFENIFEKVFEDVLEYAMLIFVHIFDMQFCAHGQNLALTRTYQYRRQKIGKNNSLSLLP